jgi:hypothetical protein
LLLPVSVFTRFRIPYNLDLACKAKGRSKQVCKVFNVFKVRRREKRKKEMKTRLKGIDVKTSSRTKFWIA